MANKTVDQLTTFSGSMSDDDLLPIFDTSESADEKLKGISVEDLKTGLNFPSMDPSALGNWVPIRERTYDDQALSGNAFTPEDGVKYKFVLDGYFDADAYIQMSLGGITSGWNNVAGFTNNAYLGAPGNNSKFYGEWILSPVDSGLTKLLTGRLTRSGSTIENINAYNSTTTGPTTVNFFEYRTQSNNFTGTYRIYQWQEIKPIELHSYELVKEYNLDGEGIDDTIDWDGEADEYCFIKATIKAGATGGGIDIRPNNDGGNNYGYGYINQNGTVVSAASNTATDGLGFGVANNETGSFDIQISLKNHGCPRTMILHDSRYNPADTDNIVQLFRCWWNNTVDDVTSLRFLSPVGATYTGNIRVYKLAKTHLFNQTIYNDLTLNVATTGSDTTGDGTSQKPFATANGALVWLKNKTINSDVTVTIQLAVGHYSFTETTKPVHRDSDKILIQGVADTGKTVTSIQSVSGTAGNRSYILNLSSVSNIVVGDYVIIKNCSNITNAEYLAGCHEVTNVDGGNTRITVTVTHRNSTAASGSLNADVVVLRSVVSSTGTTFSADEDGYLAVADLAAVPGSGAGIYALRNSYIKIIGSGVGISGGNPGLSSYYNSYIRTGGILAISNCAHGIIVYYGSTVTVNDCISSGNGTNGIFVSYGSFAEANGFISTGNTGVGIYANAGSTVRSTNGSLITGNISYGVQSFVNSTIQVAATIRNNDNVGLYAGQMGVIVKAGTTNTDGESAISDGAIY